MSVSDLECSDVSETFPHYVHFFRVAGSFKNYHINVPVYQAQRCHLTLYGLGTILSSNLLVSQTFPLPQKMYLPVRENKRQ